METLSPESPAPSTSENELENSNGVRLIVLNLPEDEGEGLGFRLTRTLWDPYPWVREVVPESRAASADLRTGDCILQADGKDLLGLPVGQVAGMIRGDGAGRGVSLVVWNCGVDPSDDPELLWSCGGGARGERARRALAGCVRALQCCVCAATATAPLCCKRSHLYCEACWKRLERCALCREPLPPKDSPYARNMVAEQVFEAIATEYEIKNVKKRTGVSASACTTPNRSPSLSPSVQRRGQYQLSMMSRKKVQFTEKFGQYASDPNIHRSTNQELNRASIRANPTNLVEKERGSHTNLNDAKNPTNLGENCLVGSTSLSGKCGCHSKVNANHENSYAKTIQKESYDLLQHKLVARLRQSCSMADLQNAVPIGSLARSINLGENCRGRGHRGSLDNVNIQDAPVFVLPAPPIYVVTCDHGMSHSHLEPDYKRN